MAKVKSNFVYKTLFLGIAGGLVGCSTTYKDWQDGKATQKAGVTAFRPLSQISKNNLIEDFSSEPQGKKRLEIGVALSGGGTRAAMFAHGVLQGLNDNEVLEKIDAISSVSGGSYTAMWYYTKRMELERTNTPYQAIFEDCVPTWWQVPPKLGDPDYDTKLKIRRALEMAGQGDAGFKKMKPCENDRHFAKGDPYRWQVHLSRWPDIFRYSETIPTGDGQGAPWPETIKLAFTSLGEVLISPLIKTGVVPSAYQYGVERAWALNPNPRASSHQSFSYTNGTGGEPQTSSWHLDPQRAQWQDLRALYKDGKHGKLPLWILNTSNAPRGTGTDQSRIFEITPFGQGSELTGYMRGGAPAIGDIGTAVRASAAALDAQGASEKYAQNLAPRNFLFPLAEWGVTVDNKFQDYPKRFRLSDGGHSENLGAYSLLRRGAQDVIIVDAAEDVEGRMGDLCNLRKMLSSEKATLTFSGELAHLDEVCDSSTNPKNKVKAYNTSAWLNPVVPGKVVWPAESGLPPSRIWLIKLGWDQQAVRKAFNAQACETREHPVSCILSAYYGHNAGNVVREDNLMYFPQLTTPGAGFSTSTYLFWAYRELGRTAAANLKLLPDGTLELKQNVVLATQPVNCVRPNLRPEPC